MDGQSSNTTVPTTVPTTDPTANTPAPTFSVLLPSYRYPTPAPFNGVRDGFACEAWLTTVRRFFLGANIADASRTVTAIAYLGATGLLWWDGQYLPDSTAWPIFVEAFRTEFRPAGFYDHIRTLLYSIRMTSTVSEYVGRTRRYLAVLCTPEMHEEARKVMEDSAKTCFLQGAPLSLRQMLLSMGINRSVAPSIHELCQAAEQYDHVYNFTPDKGQVPSTNRPDTSALQMAAATQLSADPNAMEVDNLLLHNIETIVRRVTLNALRQQPPRSNNRPNNFRTNTRQNNYRPPLRPLSDADRRNLMASGSCFRCRQQGHMASECRVNAIEGGINTPTTSGNAPSDQV
jgi:zinc knuckle protein